MRTIKGTGVVSKAGERVLNNTKLADGTYDPTSEGFYSFTREVPANFEELIAFFEAKDAKGNPINALTVGEKDEKRYLSAEESLVEIVANTLEREAKSNSYQKTLAKFKPAEDPKAAFEKIVRTFMSLGLPEDMAIKHAEAAIAENEKRAAGEVAGETVSA